MVLATDLPDHRFEESLDRVYDSLAEPMSQDDWNDIIQNGGGLDEYEIRPGDNLWDVSRTIFGTGFFWPKLWQLNSDITNPHDIQPGSKLSFLEQGLEAPVLVETELEEKTPLTKEEEIALTEDELLELKWVEPELPPGKPERRVMNQIPPSFFDWASRGEEIPDVGKVESFAANIFQLKKYYAQQIVTDMPIESVGTVRATDAKNSTTVGFYQYTYVQLDAPASIGEEFMALLETDEIEYAKNDDIKKARAVEIQGRIKIVSLVDEVKKTYKAVVVKSFRPIDMGAKLVRSDFYTTEWSEQGSYLDIEAKVFGGRYDANREVLGLGSIVYLDKGMDEGLEKGKMMNVLRNNKIRGIEAGIGDAPKIGSIRIIHASKGVSTGVVVDSEEVIQPGDFTGNPVQIQMGQ